SIAGSGWLANSVAQAGKTAPDKTTKQANHCLNFTRISNGFGLTIPTIRQTRSIQERSAEIVFHGSKKSPRSSLSQSKQAATGIMPALSAAHLFGRGFDSVVSSGRKCRH
ncbi:MAG: hypothetical protein WBB79_03825, partial [Candidatus Macondimonas sp.]